LVGAIMTMVKPAWSAFSWLVQKVFLDSRDNRLQELEKGQKELKVSQDALHTKLDNVMEIIIDLRIQGHAPQSAPRAAAKNDGAELGRAA